VIAAVGIFGAVSYSVNQRTREIGIRMALGASSAGVLRMVLGRSLLHVGCGIALGLAFAAPGALLMTSFLYGVPPIDLTTYAATSALLLVVALVATYLPARGGGRIDPARTLRED
jgi:ABC-type antimicrobial peptide transport system permease subunit